MPGPLRDHTRWAAAARRLAVAGAAAAALAACGGGRYTYVANSADRTFVRVPKEWAVLEVPAAATKSATTPEPWQRAFDASPEPALTNVEQDSPTQVAGRLTVFYVNATTADGLSAEDLRAAVSPMQADPLTLGQDGTTQKGTVKGFKSDVRAGGLKGSHVVYEIEGSSGLVTFDQTSLMDPKPYANPLTGASMFKVYVLSIHCNSACYEENKVKIADVVNSWTVTR